MFSRDNSTTSSNGDRMRRSATPTQNSTGLDYDFGIDNENDEIYEPHLTPDGWF